MNKALFFIGYLCLTIVASRFVPAAEPPSFAGEYSDKKFLNGQAVFQMSIERHGGAFSVWFSAGYNDGHGSAPEADGSGKTSGKGSLEFTFKDGDGNSGTGTATLSGDGIIVSLKPTHVADPRCMVFYKNNVHLKHVAKK